MNKTKWEVIGSIIVALCWGEALGGVISRPIQALGSLRKKTIINKYYYKVNDDTIIDKEN